MVLLLVGAAFVGGRLLSRQSPRDSVKAVQMGEGSGSVQIVGESEFEDPEEMPDEKPAVGVVTHDTKIYEESLEVNTRQVFWEPGSLDDIVQDAVVTAWGEKRGDRPVAHVLAYDLMRIELP